MIPIEIQIPIKVVTSLNSRSHWSVKAKATKRERNAVALAARQKLRQVSPLVRVTLTRFGPRRLDSDNLAGCLKGTRDQIAAELKIDDGSPLIEWDYRQETGPYGVTVLVESVIHGGAPETITRAHFEGDGCADDFPGNKHHVGAMR